MKLYKRGNTWWVRVSVSKKEYRFSTKTADYEQAMVAANQLVAPLLLSGRADGVIDAAHRVASDLKRTAGEMQAEGRTLADAWKLFPKTRPDGTPKAESSIRNAEILWRAFTREMSLMGVVAMGGVTPSVAASYLSRLKPRSAQVVWAILKAVWEANGMPSPFGRRPVWKQVQHCEALTVEQVQAVISAAEAAIHQRGKHGCQEYPLFIRFLLYTGLRLGDAATAKVSQIDFQERTFSRVMAKTGRVVAFPIHPSLFDLLPREGEYIFPVISAQYQRCRDTVSHRIRHYMQVAGISGRPHEFCPHSMRTTLAELCAEAGVPMPVVQSWLGHESIAVTRIYARVESMRSKRDAMEKLPTI